MPDNDPKGSPREQLNKLLARDIRTEFCVIPVLKNVIYEPLVLGGAVKLHLLAVVIGIVGGSILFDVPGVLLAIPTMVVFKVFVSSTARQLKAYGLA